jgi:hypothetical protein
MRRPSIRGFGIRYALALTLPVTGIALVLYTVAQLVTYSVMERSRAPRPAVRAIAGSLGGAGSPAAPVVPASPVPPGPAPKR